MPTSSGTVNVFSTPDDVDDGVICGAFIDNNDNGNNDNAKCHQKVIGCLPLTDLCQDMDSKRCQTIRFDVIHLYFGCQPYFDYAMLNDSVPVYSTASIHDACAVALPCVPPNMNFFVLSSFCLHLLCHP